MQKLRSNSHVVNLVDVFEDQFGIHLVVKNSKLGNLKQFFDGTDKLSEHVALEILYKIAIALKSLHKENIVHRKLNL